MPAPVGTFPRTPPAPAKDDGRSMIGGLAINFATDQDLSTVRVRRIHLSTAGTLAVQMYDGSLLTLILEVGWHYLRIVKIFNAGSATAVGHVFW